VLANLNLTMLPEAVRAYVLEAYLGASGARLAKRDQSATRSAFSGFFAPPEPTTDPGEPTRPLAATRGF
jgi:hypothetical protein